MILQAKKMILQAKKMIQENDLYFYIFIFFLLFYNIKILEKFKIMDIMVIGSCKEIGLEKSIPVYNPEPAHPENDYNHLSRKYLKETVYHLSKINCISFI
jgi:hypothetical protein